jgi:hypothetical protein
MLAANTVLKELDVSSNNWSECGPRREGDGPGFVKELAVGISDNGALSKLVMRQNNIHGAEAGKAFAVMLAQNTVLKELDLSSQKFRGCGDALDAAFANEFVVGISDNGALTKLDISRNRILSEQEGGFQRICAANGIEFAI